jgi:uncharacterized protein
MTTASAPAAARQRVIVMAKAPVAGLAKTRLIPALGAEGAAALAARMLAHAVAAAAEAALGPVTLCVTPDATHPQFLALAARHGLALSAQGEGDLGARMARAFAQAFAHASAQAPALAPRPARARAPAHTPAATSPSQPAPAASATAPSADAAPTAVLMIGTDAPALDAPMLRRAAAELAAGADAVFVPALDGGYALIGLPARRAAQAALLFDAMPWSTAGLMTTTRQRMAAAGWRHAELPAVADIDEPGDLVHLPAALRADPAVAR